jgi:hypothetical protein
MAKKEISRKIYRERRFTFLIMASKIYKRIPEGEPMPTDFWNYLVNPIVGYYVKPEVTPRK